jgi:hypothetical protein
MHPMRRFDSLKGRSPHSPVIWSSLTRRVLARRQTTPVFARFADVGTALTWETVTAVGSEASLGALSIAGAGQTLVAWRGSASHTDVSVFDDTGTFVFRQSVRHAGNVVGPRTLAERGNTLVVVEQHAVQPATAIFVRSCVSH